MCLIDFRNGYHLKSFSNSLILFLVLVPQILNAVLLPKRIVSQISRKINIPNYSNYELDEAFNLGKDVVSQKLRHENELINEGNGTVVFINFIPKYIYICELRMKRRKVLFTLL